MTDFVDRRLAECLERWDGQLTQDVEDYCRNIEHYTINRVQSYVFSFQYRREDTDHWKTPKEFLADKEGDCEDFAICAGAMLQKLLPQRLLWLVLCRETGDSKRYHAVLRIELSDGMFYLNDKYRIPSTEKAFLLEYEVASVTMWPNPDADREVDSAEPEQVYHGENE